ncbi:MAG: hypothetical protein FWG53_11850 [Clostridiales bacterium]|nr:hypothetical protein [Clostridiales bacterium]
MNIIRTKAVELSTIPAIAYKIKLASGGAGLKIMRLDQALSASASIDKRTGEPVSYGQADEDLFPSEAFEEVLELTSGLPYSARGKIRLMAVEQVEVEAEADEMSEEDAAGDITKRDMVTSDEYAAIVERYSDETGKMNYTLMNKDFIQFASKSKVVQEMVANKALTDEIMLFVVKSRAALIAGKKDSLDDNDAAALIETIDEIDPRSAFKGLNAHIVKLLSRGRRN